MKIRIPSFEVEVDVVIRESVNGDTTDQYVILDWHKEQMVDGRRWDNRDLFQRALNQAVGAALVNTESLGIKYYSRRVLGSAFVGIGIPCNFIFKTPQDTMLQLNPKIPAQTKESER